VGEVLPNMLAYGYSAKQAKEALKEMGDMAAATGADVEFIADAFSQLKVGNVGVGLATFAPTVSTRLLFRLS
jgi:hypothetical protein